MLPFPQIDPVALAIGPLKIHWYGLMYLVGIGGGWWLASRRLDRMGPGWTKDRLSDLVFWVAMGVIIGGRLGYVFFYDPTHQYLKNPLSIFAVTDGGMSFHGGMLGVLFSTWLFALKTKTPYFKLMDFIVPLVPIGLGAGRIGNFINAELWGRATDAPWAMIFPTDPLQIARHPSQLYQFALEGVALFIILNVYVSKPRPTMAVTGLFGICYGAFRFIVENYREPDSQMGYIAWGWLTMGQLLCVPMVLVGAALMWWAYRHNDVKNAQAC